MNSEIQALNEDKEKYQVIVAEKILQLKKLNYALIAQYLSAFTLVVSGILGEITEDKRMMIYLLFAGVIFLVISIGLLIYYAIKSLTIRQKHLKS